MLLPLSLALLAACTQRAADAPPAATATVIPATSGDGSGRTDDGKPFDNDASAVVGQPAPSWRIDTWLNGPPVTLEDLRGHVVFVRWFMGTACPMCSATAPSLNILHDKYGPRGLSVVGMYHHKDPQPLDVATVKGYVAKFGFQFPVGIDTDWLTLKRYWLDGHENRKFTSVSFLIDKKGVVRHVHLGGELAPGDPAFKSIERYVEALLAEPG